MASVKDSVKAQGMSSHISSWQQSGLSQAEYCRHNRITEQSFGYWLRKLRNQNNLELVPLRIKPEPSHPQHSPESAGICLILSEQITLELARDFDSETFARVIRILSSL